MLDKVTARCKEVGRGLMHKIMDTMRRFECGPHVGRTTDNPTDTVKIFVPAMDCILFEL